MRKVTATAFARAFGRFKEEAQREPVAITSHGRISGYFIPAAAFEEYQQLKARAAKAYRIDELPEETYDALRESRMDPRHDHLDALLDD